MPCGNPLTTIQHIALLSQQDTLNKSLCRDPGYCCRGYQQALTFGKSRPSHISSFCGNKVQLKPLCLILDDSHSHPVCLLKSERI